MNPPSPSYRKPVTALLILLLIALWALIVALFAPFVSRWPVLVQAPFYLIVGIAWILPLKPLLRWSETGVWRAVPKPHDAGEGRARKARRG